MRLLLSKSQSIILHLNNINKSKQAQTKCNINGVPCSDLVINGTEAIKDGVPNYPSVTIDYNLKICNYNDVDMRFAQSTIDSTGEVDHKSYMQFWYTAPDENGVTEKIFFEDHFYNNTEEIFASKSCKKESGSVEVSTLTSRFYMQSSLQGPLSISDASAFDKFCYAYSFNPVEFTYDYGDPKCVMSVSNANVITIDKELTVLSHSLILTATFNMNQCNSSSTD